MPRSAQVPHAAIGTILATSAVLLLMVSGLPGAPVPPLDPATGAPTATALAGPAAGPVLVNDGAFYVNNTGPAILAEVGSRVLVSYRLQVPNFAAASAPGEVRVPGTVAVLPSESGPIHIYLSASNFTVAAGGSVAAWANGSARLTSATQFNASTPANLDTQGFSVMASWPHGTYVLQAQWQWVLLASDGTQTTGPWSPWTSVAPTRLAWLANSPPTTVPLGGNFPICLSGPIAGRTFSAHLSTTSPFQTLSGRSVTVPANATGAYCWNTPMPSSVPPQSAYVHLWEYGAGTFLLYQLPVQLTGNGSGGSGLGGSGVSPVVIGAGVAGGILVLIVIAVAWNRWGARSRAGASVGPTPTPTAFGPPAPPNDPTSGASSTGSK